jgi:hypothetical protein
MMCCLCPADADSTTGWQGAPLCRSCQVDSHRRAALARKARQQHPRVFEIPFNPFDPATRHRAFMEALDAHSERARLELDLDSVDAGGSVH